MHLTLYSNVFVLAHISYPAALEDATLRDLDFVIPLIVVGDVIVGKFCHLLGGIDAVKKIRTFPNDPTFSLVPFERSSRRAS